MAYDKRLCDVIVNDAKYSGTCDDYENCEAIIRSMLGFLYPYMLLGTRSAISKICGVFVLVGVDMRLKLQTFHIYFTSDSMLIYEN